MYKELTNEELFILHSERVIKAEKEPNEDNYHALYVVAWEMYNREI